MWLLSLQLLSHTEMRAPSKPFTVSHQIDCCVSLGLDLSLGLLAGAIVVDGISRHFLRGETRAGTSTLPGGFLQHVRALLVCIYLLGWVHI